MASSVAIVATVAVASPGPVSKTDCGRTPLSQLSQPSQKMPLPKPIGIGVLDDCLLPRLSDGVSPGGERDLEGALHRLLAPLEGHDREPPCSEAAASDSASTARRLAVLVATGTPRLERRQRARNGGNQVVARTQTGDRLAQPRGFGAHLSVMTIMGRNRCRRTSGDAHRASISAIVSRKAHLPAKEQRYEHPESQ